MYMYVYIKTDSLAAIQLYVRCKSMPSLAHVFKSLPSQAHMCKPLALIVHRS